MPVAGRCAQVWSPAFRRRNRSPGRVDLRPTMRFARQRFGWLKPGLRTGRVFPFGGCFDKRETLGAIPVMPETLPISVAFCPEIPAQPRSSNAAVLGRFECSTARRHCTSRMADRSTQNAEILPENPIYSGSPTLPRFPKLPKFPRKTLHFVPIFTKGGGGGGRIESAVECSTRAICWTRLPRAAREQACESVAFCTEITEMGRLVSRLRSSRTRTRTRTIFSPSPPRLVSPSSSLPRFLIDHNPTPSRRLAVFP